jgi:TPR repeat protein
VEIAVRATPVPPVEPTRAEPPKPTPADLLMSADLAYARGSYSDAVSVLRPLAESNNAQAQVRLGRLYLEGHGVERNEGEALRLFRKAAEQGEHEARLRLGDMYAQGRGVPQNNFQAYVWYGAAARAGNVAAKLNQDRVGATMQPMEIRQAGKLIDALAPAPKER